jgi:2-methylcitrate dehydratase PrpD
LAQGVAPVWGTSLRLSPSQAALVNGTAAHALDWDDASPSMAMHPGAVLLPALLAQAAVTPATGADLVHAYDIGSAVFRAVSEALPLTYHYGLGWHNTSTTGRLAATAAVCSLGRVSSEEAKHALGIAASLASGSLANFGTMTKPLHAGLAARDAVAAVGLARTGFTANAEQLEAGRGFFAMYGQSSPELLQRLGERLAHWESEWVHDWAVKPYPSCYATHRAIDAALALRAAGVRAADVAAVEIEVREGSRRPLIDHLPRTGLEAKFSIEFTVALALHAGSARLSDFTDERATDPAISALMAKTVVIERGAAEGSGPGSEPYAVVRLGLADGTKHAQRIDISHGDSRNPLSDTEIEEKFREAVAGAGWSGDRARAASAIVRQAVRSVDVGACQSALVQADADASGDVA